MSQDQRPGKVKLYSGGGKPGAGVPTPQRRGAEALPAAAGASALVENDTETKAAKSGSAWILVLIFILGAALGGGLFTAFVPF